jgi:pyruvate kinase
MKHTKIVATIGPASETKEMLIELARSGMNVARLNFSHGSYEWHKGVIARIREVETELGMPIGILADMQGPRIRIANEHAISLPKGQKVRVSDVAYAEGLPKTMEETILLDTPKITDALAVGDEILIDDRAVILKVVEKSDQSVLAETIRDGIVTPRKGVNLPDSRLSLPILSEKDKSDLAFVLGEGVDFVGLSFVGTAEDIKDAKAEMHRVLGGKHRLPQIVAKIERKEAVKNLDKILKVTDAVMVARGDLGIEMPETEVAILQKEIIRKSLMALRPVIVATQMMKSMVENATPTRAEVSDVTNAVIDHCDAVMLSEETAQGKYPAEVVATMKEIIERTEESPLDDVYGAMALNVETSYAVIIRSAYELAKSFRAKAVVLLSMSGLTARLMSHFRPELPILVATNSHETYRQLALVWGVVPYLFEKSKKFSLFDDWVIEQAKEAKLLAAKDQVVVFLGKVPGEDAARLVGIREIK